MDWSKTKTVIIVGLIFTNLAILFFLFVSPYKNYSGTVDEASIDKVYSDENIEVADKEIIGTKKLSRYNASFIRFDVKSILKDFSKDKSGNIITGNFVWKVKENFKLRAEKADASSLQKKYMDSAYDNLDNFEVVEIDENKLKIIENFMSDKIGFDIEKEFLIARKYRNLYYVEYVQKFKNYFLEGAYIKILLEDDDILTYEQKWCDLEEIKQEYINTADYNSIMYRLLREIYQLKKLDKYSEGVRIVESRLGYGFGSEGYKVELKFGEVLAFYRFRTQMGDLIYIDAM